MCFQPGNSRFQFQNFPVFRFSNLKFQSDFQCEDSSAKREREREREREKKGSRDTETRGGVSVSVSVSQPLDEGSGIVPSFRTSFFAF